MTGGQATASVLASCREPGGWRAAPRAVHPPVRTRRRRLWRRRALAAPSRRRGGSPRARAIDGSLGQRARRVPRRARGASVGSMPAASSSRNWSSARSRSAVRASSTATSRSATSSSRGSTSWRIRLRRKRGSSLLGSSATTRPSCVHNARVSARRSARIGWRRPGPMAPRPVAPAPRSSARSSVSAWSSAVCPVIASGPSAARRAARARASRFEPAATSTRATRKPAPRRSAIVAATSASRSAEVRSPWWTWTAVTSHPAATAERDQRSGVGAPRQTAGHGRARRRKRAPIQELGDEELGDVVQCNASVEDP